MKNRLFASLFGLAVLSGNCAAQGQQQVAAPCGSPYKTSYGPYDYRIYKDRIEVQRVEDHHFTPSVEALIKPMYGKLFAPDFDYTLHTTPNHHRALAAMVRNSLKLKDPKPQGARWSVDCYFIRAMTYVPDDMIVRLLYADYLIKVGGRTPDAVRNIDFVAERTADSAFTVYNTGMLYFEAGEFEKARQQAAKAAELGLPWQELRNRLEKAGKWNLTEAGRTPAGQAAPPDMAASAPSS